uniref:Signal-induced proliferation-associated 1 like 1 n=1 Tax=Scophthalmus maximus TaxID=52904 RepID=A0A8D3BY55_SCOMX
MTSLKRSQTERSVGGSVPATDEFYTRRLRLPNGGAPPPRSESAHIPSSSTTGTNPGVPKMGVRARVADWPPRKDGGGGGSGSGSGGSSGSGSGGVSAVTAHSNLSAKLGHLISPQDSSMLRNIHNTLKNKMQSKGKDNRFLSPDGYLGSPRKGMRRIRQRSNSDITISELDGDGNEGWSFSGWTPMHREYGSTSSIDKHGVSGESFFDMLKGYQSSEAPDQRSPAPERLTELLTVAPIKQTALDLPDGPLGPARGSPASRLKEREKHLKRRSKSETGGESIFRKLRSVKVEGDTSRAGSDAEDGGKGDESGPPPKPWVCQKGFAHFDVQSLLFDLNEAVQCRQTGAKRKNTTTGASAAAAASASATSSLSSTQSGVYGSPCGSQEELCKEGAGGGHGANPALDPGDDKSNELVLSCPCFRNEIGGEGERNISPAKQGSIGSGGSSSNSGSTEEGPLDAILNTHFTNAGVAVLEAPKDGPSQHADRSKRYIVEHVDLGTYYYRKYFYLREHWNYLGVDENLGPVAVSLRREKLEEHKEHGQQYNYRVIFRTSELNTLRGSIVEDAVPSTSKHGLARGLPLKEVLEYLVPELNVHCLRLALNTPKVTEQLMKLDEQGVRRLNQPTELERGNLTDSFYFQRKVGVMYCMAGQSSEEEMYNNDSAGPALEEFLHLLGERVRLKGFTKYRAQLDTKTDSTGTHSLYTTYKDYEIMFHVSTMLPYTPNNKQQLLRKRHIGNDIVTIVFQEPGALPFTPKNIRSHFQHVFVIVRAHNPCSDNSSYSVAVTRSKDVPSFGPSIPEGVTFPKSSVFRDFLLAKVVNAENAAHKSHKFRAMATRTRQEYLRDLAERHTTSTPIDPSGKFPFISLAHKKKEKSRPYVGAELRSLGAVTWLVHTEDHGTGTELEALLSISNDFLILLDRDAKAVVFNCATKDVIGWMLSSPASLRIFYERGESVSLRSISNNTEDFKEVVKRLELLTKGCETSEMTLRRNGLGQLGFHVNYEGIVAEVEPYGYAWQAGLRQGSRLVEICKVAVATLTHEQMIDFLRTSVTVRVVIIPPHDDATPRRGCSELYRMPVSEYKSSSSDSGSFEYKFPFRSNNNKWQRTSSSPQQSLTASPQPHTPNRAISLGSSVGKTLSAERLERGGVIPRSVSSDGRPMDPKRMSPGSESYSLVSSMALGRSPHNRSSPSNLSCSSDASGSSSDGPYSGHSNSNTLSSTASSGAHSDSDKWYELGAGGASSGDQGEPEPNGLGGGGYLQGASADSGIDTSSYGAPHHAHPHSHHGSTTSLLAPSGSRESRERSASPWHSPTEGGRRMLERSPAAAESPGPPGERSMDGTGRSPPTHLLVRDSSTFSLSDTGSHSSARHSGHSSPREESSSSTTSPSSQSSVSPGPKSFYPRQGAQSKYLIGWRKPGSTINSVDFGDTRDGGVDVIPTPAARPSLRDMHSPQPHAKSTMEEDVKRHGAPDSPPPPRRHKEKHGQKSPQGQPLSHRRSLHRTLSDESIYRAQRLPTLSDSVTEPALSADVLFSCSTLPRSPTTRGVPLRRPSYKLGVKLHGDLSASDTSLVDLVERHRGPLPQELMPLPSSDRDSPMEWTHLVDVEREEKLRLQTQIKRLWEDNQRLQEESQTSAAKLKKFTEWVFNTIDMN